MSFNFSSDSDSDSNADESNPIINRMWECVTETEERHRREQAAVPKPVWRRRAIYHNHAAAHDWLFEDNFDEEPRYLPAVFRLRFRMQRPLFLRIVNTLLAHYEYFQLRTDAAGINARPVVRQLDYGGTVDTFDEYLHVGEMTI